MIDAGTGPDFVKTGPGLDKVDVEDGVGDDAVCAESFGFEEIKMDPGDVYYTEMCPF